MGVLYSLPLYMSILDSQSVGLRRLQSQSGFNACRSFCRQTCDAGIFNQYGDYSGIASFGGVSHPIWTDKRTGQRLNEEVFTASVKAKT
jgi:hypothetical protein